MYSHHSKDLAALRGVVLTLVLAILALPAKAAFFYRGDGMLYDSDRNVTWLIDASYTLVQDLSPDGRVTWSQAVTFADNFTHAGYDDWRLPSVKITDPTVKYTGGDAGFSVNTANSELAYLYYTAFRNAAAYDAQGKVTPGWGYEQPGPGGVYNNFKVNESTTNSTMQFRLMKQPLSAPYWIKGGENDKTAWFFEMYTGLQYQQPVTATAGVWLVRDGDVQPQSGTRPQVSTIASGTASLSIPRLTGTAASVDGRFGVVEYQVNGGAWAVATGTTNWTAEPRLNVGNNQIVVRALGKSSIVGSTLVQLRRNINNATVQRTGYTEYNTTFTDKSGRTALYRYAVKDGWDTTKPRGLLVYFHGNNSGPEELMLDGFFNANRLNAFERDLIPVNIASPYTRPASLVRQWMRGDMPMVHELLQSNLGGKVAIDFNTIVFAGASQGTCFLNEFLMDFAESYGGGALCGMRLHGFSGSYYSNV